MTADLNNSREMTKVNRYEYPNAKAVWSNGRLRAGAASLNHQLTGMEQEELERYFDEVLPRRSCRKDPFEGSGNDIKPKPKIDSEQPSMSESQSTTGPMSCEKAEALGYERGFAEGLNKGREERRLEMIEVGKVLQQKVTSLAQAFEVARRSYFKRLESETVELALAVAERVLRREAQIDPLLLINVVGAALRQLAKSTRVLLRVPMQDIVTWKDNLAQIPWTESLLVLVPDDSISTGQCRIETELGKADVGIDLQLAEVRKELLNPPGRPPGGEAESTNRSDQEEDSGSNIFSLDQS